jgi:hypothetical protein
MKGDGPNLWHSLRLAGIYAAIAIPLFAAWEVAHLPLYTTWGEQSLAKNIAAAMHCTFGDAVISFLTFLAAHWAVECVSFPSRRWAKVILLAAGLLTTVILELLSTQVWNRWAYTPSMPIVPGLGVGLSPLLQWLAVPSLALILLERVLKPAVGRPSPLT